MIRNTLIIATITLFTNCSRNKEPDVIRIDGRILYFESLSRSSFTNEKAFELTSLGLAEAKLLNFKNASSYYKKALRLDPKNALIHCALGSTESELDNFDSSILHLMSAIEIDSLFYEAYNNLAYTYLVMNRPQDAIRQSNIVLSSEPNRVNYMGAYMNKGLAEYDLNNLEGAVRDINKAVEYCDNPEILKTLMVYKNGFEDMLENQKKGVELKELLNQQ